MKVLYKPFGLLVSVLGGLLAGMVFKRVWKAVAGEADSPNATDRQRGWAEVVIAAGLEGALFGAVKAAVDRAGATGFARVTGTWPGDDQGGEPKSKRGAT
jgi:Protein of unknown function (DUF4235)